LVTLRPTRAQALGRGAYLGGLIGMAVGGALLLLVAGGVVNRFGGWYAALAALVAGLAVGGLAGIAFGREEGVDIDDLGIHLLPRTDQASLRWQHVDDLRAERRGGRIHVAVYLNTGQIARLRAPYDGKLLAGDPAFERKLFMLRNLWETHRYTRAPGALPVERPNPGRHAKPEPPGA
jgi:hypothetical protein